MTNVIANIKELGIPVSSHFDAQRKLKQITSKYEGNQNSYEKLISGIAKCDFYSTSAKQAELIANYLVVDSVQQHVAGFVRTPEEALKEAIDKANAFMTKNGWIVASSETAPTVDIVTGEVTNPTTTTTVKKRSGPSKKDLCVALYNKGDNKTKNRKELIELFVKELGLTPAGASTYVHNCQKGLWK